MDKFIVALSAYVIRSELLAFERGMSPLSALKSSRQFFRLLF